LNVFPISIPPLRDRKSHLQEIVHYLVTTISRRLGKGTKTIPESVMKSVMEYRWPGNIRELENVIERGIIVTKGTELNITGISGPRQEQKVIGDLKAIEKEAIQNALSQTTGNRKEAAEMLKISLRSLQYKIKEYGIG
jgi:transcriptional regulator with PAS, ATPase and Fis domain